MELTLNWTDKDLEDAITTVLANITNLDPNKGEIRVAYGLQGQPSWRHKDTVVSFYLTPFSDPYDEDISDKYQLNNNDFDKTEIFTQVLECSISCYGPNCKALATLIRAAILSDENRLSLSKVNIYPVPKRPPYRYVPYEFNHQWWQRADLSILLNVYTTISSKVNKIESANIKFITNEIGEIDVNVTPKTSS